MRNYKENFVWDRVQQSSTFRKSFERRSNVEKFRSFSIIILDVDYDDDNDTTIDRVFMSFFLGLISFPISHTCTRMHTYTHTHAHTHSALNKAKANSLNSLTQLLSL